MQFQRNIWVRFEAKTQHPIGRCHNRFHPFDPNGSGHKVNSLKHLKVQPSQSPEDTASIWQTNLVARFFVDGCWINNAVRDNDCLTVSRPFAKEARVVALVTSNSLLLHFQKNRVRIAVNQDLLYGLYVSALFALAPQAIATSTEINCSAGTYRFFERLSIHVSEHQYFARVAVLSDRRKDRRCIRERWLIRLCLVQSTRAPRSRWKKWRRPLLVHLARISLPNQHNLQEWQGQRNTNLLTTSDFMVPATPMGYMKTL